MSTILDEILAKRAERLIEARRRRPAAELEAALGRCRRRARVRFSEALRDAARINVIAEVKRASPSRGVIRADFRPLELAESYERAGAAAISVLTEEDFFGGSLEHLRQIRDRVSLPLLRKDFVFDEYQLLEAAEAGADCVLLIAAALPSARLAALAGTARDLDLDVLVEVHTPAEMRIVVECGLTLVGVNNRNLRTFEVDLAVSTKLAALAPEQAILVSESGIADREVIDRLRAAGYRAFLIGETLMRAADAGAALRGLIA